VCAPSSIQCEAWPELNSAVQLQEKKSAMVDATVRTRVPCAWYIY
jgi:hypothetical protein